MTRVQFLKIIGNSKSAVKVKLEKRKFLIALLGFIPLFSFFKQKNYENAFFFHAFVTDDSLSGEFRSKDGHYLVAKYIGEQKQSSFHSFNVKMVKQKKILRFHFNLLENRISFFYVFDSKNSFLKWGEEVEKNRLFTTKVLPNHLRYSQRKGFLFKV